MIDLGADKNTQKDGRLASDPGPCLHCGRVAPLGAQFCCSGCETVYSILSDRGLGEYYSFKYFDRRPGRSLDLQEDMSGLDQRAAGNREIEFYLEGIHCAACVWLIEKLPEWHPEVSKARLDYGRSVAWIEKTPEGSFVRIAEALAQLGYYPHPILSSQSEKDFASAERRVDLLRLGVGGVCASNIMLLSIPLYFGLEGGLGRLSAVLSGLLFIPVVTYVSWPFYRNILGSLRLKSIPIDLPVFFAIWAGGIVSFWELFQGTQDVYFDSLSALVFLLFATRLFLKGLQKKILDHRGLLDFFVDSKVDRLEELGRVSQISMDQVQIGDTLVLGDKKKIPVDGIALHEARIDESALTGEFQMRKISKGDLVFAGTTHHGQNLRLTVVQMGSDTRLGKILSQIQNQNFKKAPLLEFSDRISKYFVMGVVFLAFVLFAYELSAWGSGSLPLALKKSLSLMIVTCPCALALSIPLVFGFALSRAAEQGILFKSPDLLERLSRIREVFLDKTGTLTFGDLRVLEMQVMPGFDQGQIRTLVCALENESGHPVAKALVREMGVGLESELPAVTSRVERIGWGVEGVIQGVFYSVSKDEDPKVLAKVRSEFSIPIVLKKKDPVVGQEVVLARFELGDEIRPESFGAIQSLKKMGYEVSLLSGDRKTAVESIGAQLGISSENVIGEASPEQKRDRVEGRSRTLMVGDGANDAIALASADVGVAVQGSVDLSLRSADIYLSQGGVGSVLQLLELSRLTLGTIYVNFVFSFFYNLVGAILAITGVLSPLLAAILMPLSSFTVFFISLFFKYKIFRNVEDNEKIKR